MLLAGAVMAVWANAKVVSSPAWMWMLCIAAATMGFLLLNWPPAKIFMGDVGSTWLAFMVFALALLSVQSGWLRYAAWLVLGAVFVTDATVTLLTRMLRGERWYEAHRSMPTNVCLGAGRVTARLATARSRCWWLQSTGCGLRRGPGRVCNGQPGQGRIAVGVGCVVSGGRQTRPVCVQR